MGLEEFIRDALQPGQSGSATPGRVSDGSRERIRRTGKNFLPRCLQSLMQIFLIIELCGIWFNPVNGASDEPNEIVSLHSMCKGDRLSKRRMINSGIVLWSGTDPNMNCKVTFQTGTALQHFLIRFDNLRLDCNDKLLIFDSDHSDSEPKLQLSCKNMPSTVGSVQIPSNHLTIVFLTDQEGLDDFGFRMVITAFKKPGTYDCPDFECVQSAVCISSALVCDGVKHCDDGSDEALSAGCPVSAGNLEEYVGKNGLIAIAVGVGGLLLICLTVVIVKCSRRDGRGAYQQSLHQMQYQSEEAFKRQAGSTVSHPGHDIMLRNGVKQACGAYDDMDAIGMTSVPNMGNAVLPVDGMRFDGYTDLHLGK
ncbi:unnamed protein product [Notodromas monacha]|uniref:CUB domain-containing protein n=1 Tax=Notodromas monacha TaxID=399045 RepID=A0A7R9GEC9_9CRUS|nr:unnamed protein product [Notodromas monacha]CAG0917738.1 unnamed protein product [Notodromas monacha]